VKELTSFLDLLIIILSLCFSYIVGYLLGLGRGRREDKK
tara:strand:- start:94 stop:210 length:117 start_codon:yes stop_codon:yes gene_type:complete